MDEKEGVKNLYKRPCSMTSKGLAVICMTSPTLQKNDGRRISVA